MDPAGISNAARRAPLLLVLAAALATAACASREAELSAEFFVMGGIPVHVTAWDVKPHQFDRAVAVCRRRLQEIEASMSIYRSNSLISRVNRGEVVELDDDTATVVQAAIDVAQRTGGAFDPTVGPLVDLWKDAGRVQKLPTTDAVTAARGRVGFERVTMVPGARPRLAAAGLLLDLGGVAKGYAADAGIEVLAAHGIDRALVEIGGDLAVLDRTPSPRPFVIGIRHPSDHDRLIGRVRVARGGVVTSGSAERGIEIGGMHYSHIIDPRTGYPVRNGVLSATVLAPSGVVADAMATALMVLGEEAALDFATADPDMEAVLAVADPVRLQRPRVVLTDGAARAFTAD